MCINTGSDSYTIYIHLEFAKWQQYKNTNNNVMSCTTNIIIHVLCTGINLLMVAVHEIGHSIGLGHSSVEDAIMYAYYRGYDPNFALHSDDIAGVRSLYGLSPKLYQLL